MSGGYMAASKTSEWSTPAGLFSQLDKEFHFDLDPASTDSNALCRNHYTSKEDGLKQPWGGYRVFVNPPYGPALDEWVRKAYEERNNAEVIVMLIPARTDTRWFHDYVIGKAEIRFIKGRLKFGGAKYNAPFPNMIAVYRKKFGQFIREED